MAAPTIGATSVNTPSSSTTQTTAAVTTSVSGSTFLVFMYTSSATSCVDNMGNVYTRFLGYPTDAQGKWCNVWICENGKGGAGHTVTVTNSSASNRLAFLIEVIGSGGIDINVANVDASSPYTITSPVLARTAELALLFGGTDSTSSTGTFTESTGFTIGGQGTDGGLLGNTMFWASKTLSGSLLPITPSWTGVGSSWGTQTLITIKDVVAPSSATLSVAFEQVTTTLLPISEQGYGDWVRAGTTTSTYQRKLNGGSTITVAGQENPFSGSAMTVSYTDGTPTLSGSDTNYFLATQGFNSGAGITLTFPASTQRRVIEIWCNSTFGTIDNTLRISATLADGSAGPVMIDRFFDLASGAKAAKITLVVEALSTTTLTVQYSLVSADSGAGVTFKCAGWRIQSPLPTGVAKVLRRLRGAASSGR